MTTFTVFTGCYNSVPFIDRLFDSVRNQTFKDFEWIVFDDDSKDNTVDLIESFIENNKNIFIRFIKNKPNKGILHGYLETMRIANGRYLVQWDHDDIHKSNELEVFDKIIDKYDKGDLAGIWALCEDQNGNLLGNKYPDYISTGNYFTHFRKFITKYGNHVKNNERMPCINISKMRQLDKYIQENFPDDYKTLFPTFRWALLSMQGNKIVFVNETVRVYYVNQGHESLSQQRNVTTSKQLTISNKYWINLFFKFLDYKCIIFKFSIYKSYVYHGIISKQSIFELTKGIIRIESRLLIICLYFPVLFYYYFVKLK